MNEWYGMVIVTDHKVTSSNEIVSLSARAAPTRTRNVMTETRETKKPHVTTHVSLTQFPYDSSQYSSKRVGQCTRPTFKYI